MFEKGPYKYGRRSKRVLDTLHPDLQEVLLEVIKYVDISLLEGHRGQEIQDMYFDQGKSKLKFPKSKHNKNPSLAVDLVPWPVDWQDVKRIGAVVFFIKGIAASKGIELRIGADWNGDFKFTESFLDVPHLELRSKMVNGKWTRY